jgi:hypothetical protein
MAKNLSWFSALEPFSDPIGTDRGSGFLFLRVFFMRTGIHLARKRSEPKTQPVMTSQVLIGAPGPDRPS